jgi:hypothetical protein
VRLKVICCTLAAFTAVMMLGWPQFVGLPPKHAPKPVLKAYAVRLTVSAGVLLISFFGTAVTAALVMRQTREEYLRESAENLKMLIEGTLQDHRKKSGADESN